MFNIFGICQQFEFIVFKVMAIGSILDEQYDRVYFRFELNVPYTTALHA